MTLFSKLKVLRQSKPPGLLTTSSFEKRNNHFDTSFQFNETKFGIGYLKAKELFKQWSTTSSSYMTLNKENHLFFEQSNQAYLAFRLHVKVAITVGDPVGAPDAIEGCVTQFKQLCDQRGWAPVFFAIENNLEVYQKLGFKRLQVAGDTYLNLAELNFKGKGSQDIRSALNRAKREQIIFRHYDPEHTSSKVYEQLEGISKEWLQAKKLPELRFMLGATESINNLQVRTFYAEDKNGNIQGFVSWLPCYGANGWTLDLMRRCNGAMPGLMEFLIASSALQFQLEGYNGITLGAAPLAPVQNQRSLTSLEQLIFKLRPWLDRFYGFSNLYNFKRKFQPEWKPLYLYYPKGFVLIRVILALFISYFYKPKI